ncbi:hypothetical protein HYX02_01475 [Candidatus Woesearchaeota archaeon]|nr:hypothetical protein [Candidatus Woesearchaeota archaeon]
MNYKKRGVKKQKSIVLAVLIIVLILFVLFQSKKPSITGKVTGMVVSEETVLSENLNLQVNESGTYEWEVKNPGNIKSLKATGSASANGTARVYIEKNGTRYLLFDSTKQLFDVNIHVLPEYKKTFQGGEVLIQNILFNLRGFGAGDVEVKYAIKDQKGNIIASEMETVFIETQAKFIRSLLVPSDLRPGNYVALVKVTYADSVGTSSDIFEVKAKAIRLSLVQLKDYRVILLLGLIAVLVIFAFSVYKLGYLKKRAPKAKVEEIKELKLEEKAQKLKKELEALEQARKSGFISEESYQKDKKRIEEKLKSLK